MKLEQSVLRRMWPKAPMRKIETICRISEEVFAEYGIDDWNVVAELMGNISHENGAGTIVRESGNYSADRISYIFGPQRSSAKVSPEEAAQLARNGPALFNRVYGPHPKSPKLTKTLGNTEPGDGWKYRGGGDLQLTGRYNYTRIGKLTGHPEIIDNPDLLSDPEVSFRVAVAEFAALGCIPLAKAGRTKAVRTRINGGSNGMEEVVVWVHRWKAVLPQAETPIEAPRGADTGTKSILSSKIVQSAAGTAASAATAGMAEYARQGDVQTEKIDLHAVSDKIAMASDTITTITVAKENATAIVQTVKPLFGLPSRVWATIAVVAVIASFACIGWTIYERWKKKRESGE